MIIIRIFLRRIFCFSYSTVFLSPQLLVWTKFSIRGIRRYFSFIFIVCIVFYILNRNGNNLKVNWGIHGRKFGEFNKVKPFSDLRASFKLVVEGLPSMLLPAACSFIVSGWTTGSSSNLDVSRANAGLLDFSSGKSKASTISPLLKCNCLLKLIILQSTL